MQMVRISGALNLALLLVWLSCTIVMGESVEAQFAGLDVKDTFKGLNISMGGSIIDERTVVVRANTSLRLRLGNVAPLDRESLGEQYEGQLKKVKGVLSENVQGQLILWKAAPDQNQNEVGALVADVWTSDGKHINGFLLKNGLLAAMEEYKSELARDILAVAAEQEKKKQYEKLEEALKETSRVEVEATPMESKLASPSSWKSVFWCVLVCAMLLGVGVVFPSKGQQKQPKPKKIKPKRNKMA